MLSKLENKDKNTFNNFLSEEKWLELYCNDMSYGYEFITQSIEAMEYWLVRSIEYKQKIIKLKHCEYNVI